MSEDAPTLRLPRVWFARVEQWIGSAGLGGLALLAAAAMVLGLAWTARSKTTPIVSPPSEAAAQAAPQDTSSEPVPRVSLDLASAGEVPLLLTHIKQIAVINGLGWAAADYRIVPATDNQPASLELHSTFKATYPKLRSLVSQVLREVPAATLRELSFSRGSSDVAEIEAKLTIAVLLQDEPTVAIQRRAKAAP